jgi:hypothetical protein
MTEGAGARGEERSGHHQEDHVSVPVIQQVLPPPFFLADVDRGQVLAAQDVPPELLLAAVVVLVIGAILTAMIGWQLLRRQR